ncbi:hypothetical protein THASP1DRAFT_27269 [Thamnocephalis sphaerospora]|uniref:Annexin n=1 Tax=Thamnocephalis sphaerospora TaxID=78915 RepID=A0A4P9XZP7_9FUNG|nr:hypothetical protein THASP1DRAFT_27269 [Thamnocephalis sphaerospora]|eukprot:RKP10960.1 hypothetical protein THASP1DRAFT_27269 [Thamnocephalis sphaerospora]
MSAQADAEAVYRACKGFGTDESTLIKILGHRDWAQLQSISQWYQHLKGEDMLDRLRRETSGDFGRALVDGCKHPVVYDAELIHGASKGLGTSEGVIIEVLIRRSNEDIQMLNQTYTAMYHTNLTSVMRSEFSGNAQYLFSTICLGQRQPGVFDPVPDADALQRCFHGDIRTDEVTLIHILTGRSDEHLRNVFNVYMQRYQARIEDMVRRHTSGDLQRGLVALVKCVQDAPLYVAEILESAMAGLGTNERRLSRVTIRNRGPFMEHVKLSYLHRYGKTLRRRIEGDTSGDYRKLLLAYINDS